MGRTGVRRGAARVVLGAALTVALVASGCGGDDDDTDVASATTTTAADTTTSTSSAPVGLEQPAIWPAADVVFETPEEAAGDFVREVLGVEPVLGEFQQGDSRSGEIEVFSPGEGAAATPIVRGLLLLRQLGPDDGWFVLAAVSDNQQLTAPESMAEVAAGRLTVEGVGRGFEATIVVTARPAGQADDELDRVIAMGGSMETPEPYQVELDLTGAAAGTTVMLLAQGGTGLETDPGDFAAIPVVIAG